MNKNLKRLQEADSGYYNNDKPIMSDKEYDALKDAFTKENPTHPYLKKVGDSVKGEHWKKASHTDYPMGSLSKVNSIDDLQAFLNKQEENSFIFSEKLDGISVKLIYDNGKLIQAITRGDGEKGEDITRNVLKMKIPTSIIYKGKLVIRGEILLKESDFRKMEQFEIDDIEKKGTYSLRNIASGMSKKLDGEHCHLLSILVYDIMNCDETPRMTRKSQWTMHLLTNNNFEVPYFQTYYNGIDNVEESVTEFESKRKEADYDIDGIVIEDDYFKKPGDDWSHPKNKIAFKYKDESRKTKLIDVIWEYDGNRLSPVGVITPVIIDGANIQRVTLNNMAFINEMELHINDMVEIVRAGQVIPKILKVLEKAECPINIIIPEICPVCGFPVVSELKMDGEASRYLICSNPDCSAKTVHSIIKWLDAHESKGVSEQTITKLFDAGLITSLLDFFTIETKKDLILNLEGFSNKRFNLIVSEMNKTLFTDIVTFMKALNISNFGRTIFENIYKVFEQGSITKFLKFCNEYPISNISGISIGKHNKLKEEILNRTELIKNLLEYVTVNPKFITLFTNNDNSKLEGLSFCFTGKLETKRSELVALVKSNGGKEKAVTKTLDYLVTNDTNSGSSKNKKANELGVKIITQAEFMNIIK